MHPALPRTFAYDPQWRIIGFMGIAVLGILLLVYLGWYQESLARWAVCIFGGLSLLLIVRRAAFKRVIELGANSCSVPSGFMKLYPKPIAYKDIMRVWQSALPYTAVLHVATATTKVEILSTMLVNAESYVALRNFFLQRQWLGSQDGVA